MHKINLKPGAHTGGKQCGKQGNVECRLYFLNPHTRKKKTDRNNARKEFAWVSEGQPFAQDTGMSKVDSVESGMTWRASVQPYPRH